MPVRTAKSNRFKTQIADHIYGIGADIEERVVEIYVSRLRKKLVAFQVPLRWRVALAI